MNQQSAARWKLPQVPPVEHRLFGLDRRLIWPTVGVYLVVLLWSVVMPAIDQAVDNRKIVAGTVYDIGPAKFTPTPGWVLSKPPSPVGQSTDAAVFKGGLTFQIKGGVWHGTAQELLDRIARDQREFVVEGSTVPTRSAQGVAGLARKIQGPNYVGLLLSFVDKEQHGVTVMVKGPVAASQQLAQPVADMIRSIVFESSEVKK